MSAEVKHPVLAAIIRYVRGYSWFSNDDWEENNYVSFTSREYGDISNETPGKEDFSEARRLSGIILNNPEWKDKVTCTTDYTDEWVNLTVRLVKS